MAVLDAAAHRADAMESSEQLAHQQTAPQESPAQIAVHLTATSSLTVPGSTLTPIQTPTGSAHLGKVITTGDPSECHALAELSSKPTATVANTHMIGFANAHPNRWFQTPILAKKIADQFVTAIQLQQQLHLTLPQENPILQIH